MITQFGAPFRHKPPKRNPNWPVIIAIILGTLGFLAGVFYFSH